MATAVRKKRAAKRVVEAVHQVYVSNQELAQSLLNVTGFRGYLPSRELGNSRSVPPTIRILGSDDFKSAMFLAITHKTAQHAMAHNVDVGFVMPKVKMGESEKDDPATVDLVYVDWCLIGGWNELSGYAEKYAKPCGGRVAGVLSAELEFERKNRKVPLYPGNKLGQAHDIDGVEWEIKNGKTLVGKTTGQHYRISQRREWFGWGGQIVMLQMNMERRVGGGGGEEEE